MMAKRAVSNKYPLSAEAAAKAIGILTKDWEGNCFGIARALVKAGLVEGKAVYGTYGGPMSERGYWTSRAHAAFTHHGWIVGPDRSIIDPTRWSFEAVKPYIFRGQPDHPDYDAFGFKARRAMMEPCPRRTGMDQLKTFNLSEAASAVIASLTGEERAETFVLSVSQVFWLANLDPNLLGSSMKEIYEAIIGNGFAGFIPIDSRQYVFGNVY